jgi:hypothetical protein
MNSQHQFEKLADFSCLQLNRASHYAAKPTGKELQQGMRFSKNHSLRFAYVLLKLQLFGHY